MKIKKADKAISEIVGALLLLLIALAILSLIYAYVLFYPLPDSDPHVEIVGSLEGDNIVLLHRGGEALGLDTTFRVDILNSTANTTDYMMVGNCLDSESKNDGFWNIGEILVYPVGDITGSKVHASVVDSDSESTIFRVWFRETFSDIFEFSVEIGKEGNMICIPGTLNVIVVYTDNSNDGWVQTIELAPDGGIAAILDSLEFDSNFCRNPNLIHISGSIYALCYQGQGGDGTLKTLQITSDGIINDTIRDSLVFDTECSDPDFIHISGNIFSIAYEGKNDDGFLKTIEILSDGTITSVQDELEFDTDDATAPDINHIIGDIYAIVYSGKNDDGFLVTVEIAANGDITDPVNDSLEFDTNTCIDPDITHVYDDIYAIAYEGVMDDGYLITVEIRENGDINNTVIETMIFDASKAKEPEIIHVSGSIFAIAYSGSGDAGNVITARISNDGSIIDPTVDFFEFSAYGKTPRIIRISSNYYAISYRDTGNEGLLTTVHIADNGEFL